MSLHFIFSGRFDHSGLAEGEVDSRTVGPVRSLRVKIHTGCLNWVIMTEVIRYNVKCAFLVYKLIAISVDVGSRSGGQCRRRDVATHQRTDGRDGV